jgi:hypothetical protein
VELHNESGDHRILHQPQGLRATKEDQKNTKLKMCALHVQSKTIVDMATTMMNKAKILQELSTFQLFTMP